MTVAHSQVYRLGYSDYGDIILKRNWKEIEIERYHPLDYDYMDEYIDNNIDLLSEWQDAVYHWNTEESFNEWRQDYEYPYDDYFNYNGDTDEYYNENDGDYTYDYFCAVTTPKDVLIQQFIETFEDSYDDWNFERGEIRGYNDLRETLSRFYDQCLEWQAEKEESQKPHWKAFSYYK